MDNERSTKHKSWNSMKNMKGNSSENHYSELTSRSNQIFLFAFFSPFQFEVGTRMEFLIWFIKNLSFRWNIWSILLFTQHIQMKFQHFVSTRSLHFVFEVFFFRFVSCCVSCERSIQIFQCSYSNETFRQQHLLECLINNEKPRKINRKSTRIKIRSFQCINKLGIA